MDTMKRILDICYQRGISEEHLRIPITKLFDGGSLNPLFQTTMSRAAAHVLAEGLEKQLEFLIQGIGLKRTEALLMRTGGILDAIVKQTSDRPNKEPR